MDSYPFLKAFFRVSILLKGLFRGSYPFLKALLGVPVLF